MHRRRSLAGSPAQHMKEAKDRDAKAARMFRQAQEQAQAGRCASAIQTLLDATFSNGMSQGNIEWAREIDEYDRNPSGTEVAEEDAVDAFEQACIIKSKFAGLRRRRSRR